MKTNIKEVVNFLKEHMLVVSLSLYAISLTNYYLYFWSFGISIFSYVTINDLVFSITKHVLDIFAIVLIIEILLFITYTFYYRLFCELLTLYRRGKLPLYMTSTKANKERILKIFEKGFSPTYTKYRLTLLIIQLFLLITLPALSITIPAYFISFTYSLSRLNDDAPRLRQLFYSFICLILLISLFGKTLIDSYNIRYDKTDFDISFKESNNLISTAENTKLNFLGETSLAIFVYDIEKKKARIYGKSDISVVEINNSKMDKNLASIKQTWLFKQLAKVFRK